MDPIREKYKRAFLTLDIQMIQEIVLDLNEMNADDKEKYRDLYVKIKDDLFEQNLGVNNLDIDAYDRDIAEKRKRQQKPEKGKGKDKPEKSFDQVFCEFYNQSCKIFPDLKYHFLFQLSGVQEGIPNLFIITDQRFSNHPLVDKIISVNPTLSPKKFTVRDFESQIALNSDLIKTDSILLLVISPMAGSATEFQVIHDFLKNIKNCRIIKVKKADDLTKDDYQIYSINTAEIEEVEKITNNFLNNKDINHEEEKIIKLLLPNNTSITDYSILKSGFSGSKVIEVRPIKNIPGSSPIRLVIKYAKITDERKIRKERGQFEECLEDLKAVGYICKYAETDLYEGIRYYYASSDSRTDSHSFASLIDELAMSKGEPKHDLIKTLDDLFNCEPFAKWTDTMEVKKLTKDLYADYIVPESVFKKIALLENESVQSVESSVLGQQFSSIIQYELETKEKICHGDLHTENLFKDDKAVYLIDFGYTGWHHAILDYTTLEASIKFKHFPRYIPVSELIDLENKLMDIGSFKAGFVVDINRPILKSLAEVILKIRCEAVKFLRDSGNVLEYFISLFVMSFRQIQYPDLNQRYALESSKILGNYIQSSLS